MGSGQDQDQDQRELDLHASHNDVITETPPDEARDEKMLERVRKKFYIATWIFWHLSLTLLLDIWWYNS